MFEYRGRSEQFRKTVETYGPRLAKIYKDTLKRYFGDVERLTTSGLFYTPERGRTTVKSVMTDIDELFQRNAMFFMQSMEISHLNEAVTRELDRRVLGALAIVM